MTRKLSPEHSLSSDGFRELFDAQPEEHAKVMMRGSLVAVPRKQQAYGRAYAFSGVDHAAATQVPRYVEQLQQHINELLSAENCPRELSEYRFQPNGVLVNWYRNGHDYIGPHRDETRELQKLGDSERCLVVASSHGTERVFRVRDASSNKAVLNLPLANNTLCVMGGEMQQRFKHEIVRVNGVKGEALGPRISITFRQFVNRKKRPLEQ